jgi:hypothetical protein
MALIRQPPQPPNTKGNPTKRIVRTLTTESSGGNRFTYDKELLNPRKNSNFHKTNHSWLCRVSPPALTARKSKWQTNETNRLYLKLNLPEVIALRTKKRRCTPRETMISAKRIIPASAGGPC